MLAVPEGLADYQILSLAGRGAFGSVWVARDRTGVVHAVKVVDLARLPGHDAGDREEHALALVRQRVPRHPNLVEISHVSRIHGQLVYAMELADAAHGSPLAGELGYNADTLAQRIASSGRLPVQEGVPIALNLLSALAALHAAQLVHRDVKPHNVIFIGGVPKLADIGLAAVVQTILSVAGTPGYLPLDGSTGPDADLYAVGKVLYVMLTGLPPADFPTLPAELVAGQEAALYRRLNRFLLRACTRRRSSAFARWPKCGKLCTKQSSPAVLVDSLLSCWLIIVLAGVSAGWFAWNLKSSPLDTQPSLEKPSQLPVP